MSRFVLIDHSLKGVGGHHFEYATHVLAAARRAGFEAILATHRKFSPSAARLADCPVHPLFRQTTYGADTLFRSGGGREHRLFSRLGTRLLGRLSRSWTRAA